MTSDNRFRVIFLGERRICWEALKALRSKRFSSSFDIRVLVSDIETYQRYGSISDDRGLVFIKNDTRRSEDILSAIKSNRVNLLISVQYNWILTPEILDSVGRRAFNLHNAKLPSYKGYNSISHAILNGDSSYESTIHWMDDAVDSGDAAFVGYTEITKEDTARSLYLRTIDAAMDAFDRFLTALSSGEEVPRMLLARDPGHFYGKNSLERLSNVTDLVDKQEIAKIARAVFFPPFNTAYFIAGGSTYLVVPASECANLGVFGDPVNSLSLK